MSQEQWWDVIQVWKVPSKPVESTGFGDIGIYPVGELMALYVDEDQAQNCIERLRNFDSERFDEEPYKFILSYREFDG